MTEGASSASTIFLLAKLAAEGMIVLTDQKRKKKLKYASVVKPKLSGSEKNASAKLV